MRVRKISSKLLLLLAVSFLLYAGLDIASHLGASRVYDSVLTQSIDYILSFVAADIDRRMSEIENASLAMMTGADFQALLLLHDSATTSYDRNELRGRIHDLIEPYTLTPYVQEVVVIDESGRLIVDDEGLSVPTEDLKPAIRAAEAADGAVAWVSFRDGRRLLASRRIRRIDDFSFDPIGIIVIEVDVRSMLADNISDFESLGVILTARSGDTLLLSNGTDLAQALTITETASRNGGVLRIGRVDYLKYSVRSFRSDRTYTAYLPRSAVYVRIDALNRRVMMALLAITAIAIAAAIILTTHITRPLETLVTRLRRLEDADFSDPAGVGFTIPSRSDEIGVLYREVDAMFAKINRLINENFKKLIAVKDNQFRTLQAQINPHFLYNTLESINWLAKLHGREEIARMTKSLGNLLRASITGAEYAVTVGREIELLKNYLTIQKIRYEDDLQCEVEVGEDIAEVAVPKLIVQPLVENSIKYSLEYRKKVCHIRVEANIVDDHVEFRVSDDGPGMDNERLRELNLGRIRPRGSGVGIRNIAERLSLIYGPAAWIRVESTLDVGTTVRLSIPIATVEDLENRVSS